jgi:Putative methyltransferase
VSCTNCSGRCVYGCLFDAYPKFFNGASTIGRRTGVCVSQPDWVQWQQLYENPERVVAQRLLIVQRLIREFLAARAGDEVSVVSVCAGQGRDILGVLADHPDRGSVRGYLVELNPTNTAAAVQRAHEAGLNGIDVVTRDASTTDSYAGIVPADLVLVCGVFGNIRNDDIHRTIEFLPQFCACNATVIWTRHRAAPDLTPTIRQWFEGVGFVELAFESTGAEASLPGKFPPQSVGAHRWPREAVPLELGRRLFSFFR